MINILSKYIIFALSNYQINICMKNQENNNLAKENAALKQKLQQKEKELASIAKDLAYATKELSSTTKKLSSTTKKVNELARTGKALANQLERSKKKCTDLKSTLDEMKKKPF